MRGNLGLMALLTAWLVLGAMASLALADGGALRFSECRDGYQVAIFTTPTPLRVGLADISTLVQDADSGRPSPDVAVALTAYPIQPPQRRIRAVATTEAATNKLFRAARLELSTPGRWHVEIDVSVSGANPGRPFSFEVDVADALPPWLRMSPWFAWPLLVIGLFVFQQIRAESKKRQSRPHSRILHHPADRQ